MNRFIPEAFIIGAKEGIVLISCVLLVRSFFRRRHREELMRPLAAGIITVFFASFAVISVTAPVSIVVRDVIIKMVGYIFGLFFLFSLGALFHTTSDDIPRPLIRVFSKSGALTPLVFLFTFLYFAPEMAGSFLSVKDLFDMSGKSMTIPVSSAAGFAVACGMLLLLPRRRARIDIMALFGLPQVLLFLALVKLVGGGVRGFAELSLIPSVQAGLMKLIHDVVHQTLILAMIPDHPLLTMTAWKYIGLLFGNTFALWLSLVIITVPLILFIKKHFAEKVTVPRELTTGALRRRFIKSVKDERVLKSLPIFLFMIVISITWFLERGESLSQVYNPVPTPVVAAGDTLSIPLRTPAEELLDGSIHKFTVTLNEEVIRLLLMKRENGTLAVCLDTCEVCPPQGYAQVKERLMCLYCKTPIPADSLGKPGGCNPIPLNALVTADAVKIDVAELKEKWAMIKRGESKEIRVR